MVDTKEGSLGFEFNGEGVVQEAYREPSLFTDGDLLFAVSLLEVNDSVSIESLEVIDL